MNDLKPLLNKKNLIAKIEYYFNFPCLLFAVYIMVFVRQYFWGSSDLLAWSASVISSILISPLILKATKWNGQDENNWKFFLIVILPLTCFYLLRFAFPDSSWDVINYHYINGERALRGEPFIKGDFFYLSYSNPVSDMLTGVFRHILGHRLGTVVNLLVLFWTALIANKILSRYVKMHALRYLLIITLLSFEGIIYEVSNYWVDLLAIPIVLEIVYLMAFVKVRENYHYISASLLMGVTVAFKLTNLYFVLPAAIIFAVQYLSTRNARNKLFYVALFGLVFLFPLIPFHGYIFSETGNPIYPHFNSIFKSPYFSIGKVFDNTLGPSSTFEAFLWPLVMLFKSERLSPTPMYPIITAIGYMVSIAGIAQYLVRRDKTSAEFAIICVAYFSFAFLWGVVSGDFRYVTVLELLGGIVIVMFFYSALKIARINNDLQKTQRSQGKFIFYVFILVLFCFAKIGFSLNKILKYDWAGRPSVFSNFSEYVDQLKYVLRDYSLHEFLSIESKNIVDQVEVWVPSSPVVSGYMVLLNPYLPYLDLHHLPMRGSGGLKKFNETVDLLGTKRYFSLIKVGTLGLPLNWSLDELVKGGFQLIQLQKFSLPYFSNSPDYNYDFTIVEVVPLKYESELVKRLSKNKVDDLKASLVNEEWESGCSSLEGPAKDLWRWCDKSATVSFKNYSDISIVLTFNFNVQTGHNISSNFYVGGNSFKETTQISAEMTPFSKSIILKGGEKYTVSFNTDSQKVNAPGDPRPLYLKFTEFKYSASPLDKGRQ